jgi:hypothetical protein
LGRPRGGQVFAGAQIVLCFCPGLEAAYQWPVYVLVFMGERIIVGLVYAWHTSLSQYIELVLLTAALFIIAAGRTHALIYPSVLDKK